MEPGCLMARSKLYLIMKPPDITAQSALVALFLVLLTVFVAVFLSRVFGWLGTSGPRTPTRRRRGSFGDASNAADFLFSVLEGSDIHSGRVRNLHLGEARSQVFEVNLRLNARHVHQDGNGSDVVKIIVRRPRKFYLHFVVDFLRDLRVFVASFVPLKGTSAGNEDARNHAVSGQSLRFESCSHDSAGCNLLRTKVNEAASAFLRTSKADDPEHELAILSQALRALAYLHKTFPTLPLHDLAMLQSASKSVDVFGPIEDLAEIGASIPAELVEVSFSLGPEPSATAHVRSRALRTQHQARKIAGDLVDSVAARADDIFRLPGSRTPTSPFLSPSYNATPGSEPVSPLLLPAPSKFLPDPMDLFGNQPPRPATPNHLGLSQPTLVAVLSTLIELLESRQGREISVAIEDPLVQLASGVAKRVPKKDETEAKRKNLEDWVVASKLGLVGFVESRTPDLSLDLMVLPFPAFHRLPRSSRKIQHSTPLRAPTISGATSTSTTIPCPYQKPEPSRSSFSEHFFLGTKPRRRSSSHQGQQGL